MASSLAIAVIEADMVVTAQQGSVQVSARVGERLVARAKVGTKKGNKNVVRVRIRVGEQVIFVGRFITVEKECLNGSFESERCDPDVAGS
jgi:hypothetical protein